MRNLFAATLAAVVLAPCAALSQTEAEAPAPAEEKKSSLIETLGGAVGGALGSTAGAAGGPAGSAAGGLVGQRVGQGAGGFVRRIFGGKPKPKPRAPAPAASEQVAEHAPHADPLPAETGDALPASDIALEPVDAAAPSTGLVHDEPVASEDATSEDLQP